MNKMILLKRCLQTSLLLSAATLSVRPPALRDLAVQGRFSDEELVELVLRGRPGTPMP